MQSSLFLSTIILDFQGVRGLTGCVGALKVVASLIAFLLGDSGCY